jgi:hypothetical protein
MKTLDIKSLIIGVLLTACVGLALGLRPAGSGIRPMIGFPDPSLNGQENEDINVLQITRLNIDPKAERSTIITTSNGGSLTVPFDIWHVEQRINDALQ